mmetsp:Transcript_10582/g.17763  ORF Transcript_10582/g.17763 Transcript_10582/m.17763 type:complete len:292 (-) Transcript_10582:483-1358(-)
MFMIDDFYSERKGKRDPLEDFTVTFRVQMKVEYGQQMCVAGSADSLGGWNDFQAKMEWTEDDWWLLRDVPVKAAQSVFLYKYVVLNPDSSVDKWEEGPNRIADLQLLSLQDEGMSDLMMLDQWNSYTVNFSIYYPLKDNEFMRINGEPEQLGGWLSHGGPVTMRESLNEVKWLTEEYVRPWELKVRFKHGECPSKITYKYSIRNDVEDTTVWEREPTRILNIKDPREYKGELGAQESDVFRNTDDVFIVNGHVEMSDANFVGGLNFDRIGNTDIFLGPYPQTEEDVVRLHE